MLGTSTLHSISLAPAHLWLELGSIEPLLPNSRVLLQLIPLVLRSFAGRDTMTMSFPTDGAKLMKLKSDLVSMLLINANG